jgi:hypothetical protein
MTSNSCAAAVAEEYINLVEKVGFTSEVMAVDPGTANNLMTNLHAVFNHSATGCVKVTHSHLNMVAEIVNGKVDSAVIFPLLDRFTELEAQGWFVYCIPKYSLFLREVMFDYVVTILTDWVADWNVHPIRKQARLERAGRPWGRVDVMYDLPERFGLVDARVPVSVSDIAHARTIIADYRAQTRPGPPTMIATAYALPEQLHVRTFVAQRKAERIAAAGRPMTVTELVDLYKEVVVFFKADDHVLQ